MERLKRAFKISLAKRSHGAKLKVLNRLRQMRQVSRESEAGRVTALEQALLETRQRLEEMTRLAYFDPLTGVGNRRAFDLALQQASDRATPDGMPSVVALFDIDRLKTINDVLGHKAGDAAIRATAHCLCQHTRGSDFVARIGGDEFAVILANIDRSDAQKRAEALRDRLSQIECIVDGTPVSFSVSIGLSPISAELGCHALHVADQTMYGRKQAARSLSRL